MRNLENKLNSFEHDLEEIEENFVQLKNSMALSYDSEFHLNTTKLYSKFIRKIISSKLNDELKLIYINRLSEIIQDNVG